MLAHYNSSGYSALLFPTSNHEGRETAVAIAKATFRISPAGELQLAEEQEPVVFADVLRGDDPNGGVVYESDLAIYKPGTDVIVNGECVARGEQPVRQLDVTIEAGSLAKTIRVYGDRVWERMLGLGPLKSSTPEPFVHMPMIYERAFGGADPRKAVEDVPTRDSRNPCGRGFHGGFLGSPGVPLPNLENPSELLHGPTHKPQPWGCGFVGRAWEGRRHFAGRYDASWIKDRMPVLPIDFDYRYFHGASSRLSSSRHFAGNEPVRITNMTPEGQMQFKLPGIQLGLSIFWHNRRERGLAALDTVIIEPGKRRVMLTWRKPLVCRRKFAELIKVMSFCVHRWAAREILGPQAEIPAEVPCLQ